MLKFANDDKPSFFEQSKENISNFFGDAKDFAELVGAFLEFISGFLDYLGLFGFFLFLISLVLLVLTNAVSPLSKLSNYLSVCVFVCLVYLVNIPSVDAVIVCLRYLSIMIAPLVITYTIKYGSAYLGRMLGRDGVTQRFVRIRDLAAEITQQAS